MKGLNMGWSHYVLRNFDVKLDADIYASKSNVVLYIWLKYEWCSGSQLLFNRKCKNVKEALEILNGFGHGFEYTGTHWEKV